MLGVMIGLMVVVFILLLVGVARAMMDKRPPRKRTKRFSGDSYCEPSIGWDAPSRDTNVSHGSGHHSHHAHGGHHAAASHAADHGGFGGHGGFDGGGHCGGGHH